MDPNTAPLTGLLAGRGQLAKDAEAQNGNCKPSPTKSSMQIRSLAVCARARSYSWPESAVGAHWLELIAIDKLGLARATASVIYHCSLGVTRTKLDWRCPSLKLELRIAPIWHPTGGQ